MKTNKQKKIISKVAIYKDHIEIRFIPLPPEKRSAWEDSIRLLKEIILEVVAQNANGNE